MRKFLLKNRSMFIFFLLLISFMGFSIAFAAPGEGSQTTQIPSSSGGLNPLGSVNNIWELLINIFGALLELALPIAVLMIVYSGYLFVSAMGDEKQVNSAKDNLKWTLVGLAVLLGARALVDLVRETIQGLGN